MPMINRPPIGANNNDDHLQGISQKTNKKYKNHDTSRKYALIIIGSAVTV